MSRAVAGAARKTRIRRPVGSHPLRIEYRSIVTAAIGYPMAEAMVKIGRYIATTMKPTVTPRNTIIMGSRSAVRFATASSTSSS